MNLGKPAKAVAGVVLGLLALLGLAYLLIPDQLATWALQAERDHSNLVRRETDIPGFHIVYLEGGSGPPLLLLHGIGADKDNWTGIAGYLVPHFHVIAPDLPGFGESDKPADADYGIDAQVERLAQLAAALKLQRFDLGGNSMGGWIAAAYAVAHPDAVHSLWLLDPGGVAAGMQRGEMAARIREGLPVPLFAQNIRQFREVLHFVFVHPPYIPGAVERLLAHRQAQNYALNLRIFEQLKNSKRTLDAIAKGLKTPTLIVWGAGDRVLHPAGAEALHALLPNSQVVVMPDVGHLPMTEAPQACANDYLRFRETIDSSSATTPQAAQ